MILGAEDHREPGSYLQRADEEGGEAEVQPKRSFVPGEGNRPAGDRVEADQREGEGKARVAQW